MHAILLRIESGDRRWAAEASAAAAAFVLLSIAVGAADEVCRLVRVLPAHDASPLAFAVAAVAVVSGCAGWACLLEGPGLFRLVPAPVRRLI